MNSKLSFGLTLIVGAVAIFLVTFNLFYIIAFIIKLILYASAIIAVLGGINAIVEYLTETKHGKSTPKSN